MEVTGALPATKPAGEDLGAIAQWRLIARRFRQNRLSMIGGIVLIILYLSAALADFIAPYPFDEVAADYQYAPPTPLTIAHGGLAVYPMIGELNLEEFRRVYTPLENSIPVRFFVHGAPYKFLGVLPTDIHLYGVDMPYRIYLFGADFQGRDLFTRVLQGGRVSLTIGLLGIAIATVLGSVLGTVSAYYGGMVDNVMQRAIELIQSFPGVALWAAVAAALPTNLPVVQRYFYISVILSLISWTELARQVRGKVLSYREADYTAAARVAGASDLRIIMTHLVPNAMSHIIVVAALAIPGSILGETALSFLGLGMLPPAVSWGVLMRDAQQLQAVLLYPWLLIPGGAVIVTVLCFSFLGDGLRDAVDPYG
jgi:peptide/nickel transport system permease protein